MKVKFSLMKIFNKKFPIMPLFTAIFISNITHAQTYNIGFNGSSGPDFFYKGNRIQGTVGDIFQCALDVSDIQYHPRKLPVARLLYQLKNGDIDVAVGLAKTEERDEIATYASPLLTVPYFFISADPTLNTSSNFSNTKIAGLRHSNIINIIRKLDASPYEVDTFDQAIKMATLGRVIGTIVPKTVLSHIDKSELSQVNIFQIDKQEISFYISKKSKYIKPLIAQINQGISECKKE